MKALEELFKNDNYVIHEYDVIDSDYQRKKEIRDEEDPEKRFELYKKYYYDLLCETVLNFENMGMPDDEVKQRLKFLSHFFWDKIIDNDGNEQNGVHCPHLIKVLKEMVILEHKLLVEKYYNDIIENADEEDPKVKLQKLAELERFINYAEVTPIRGKYVNDDEDLMALHKRVKAQISNEFNYEKRLQDIEEYYPEEYEEYEYFEEISEGKYITKGIEPKTFAYAAWKAGNKSGTGIIGTIEKSKLFEYETAFKFSSLRTYIKNEDFQAEPKNIKEGAAAELRSILEMENVI